MCIGCDEVLTIEHMLLTCSDLKRATLQLNHCVCSFGIFHLRKKKKKKKLLKVINIFGEKIKREITIGYVYVLLIF